MCAPAGLHGTGSGPSKSRNLVNKQGEPFRPARAKHAHGKPRAVVVQYFGHCCLVVFPKYRSSPKKLGSHVTTAALQVFSSVTATNGAAAAVCLSVLVRVYHTRYSSKKHEDWSFSIKFYSQYLFCRRVLPMYLLLLCTTAVLVGNTCAGTALLLKAVAVDVVASMVQGSSSSSRTSNSYFRDTASNGSCCCCCCVSVRVSASADVPS